MDGLTNIIEKIHKQNDIECRNIVESAEKKAGRIIEEAKKEATLVASEIASETEAKLGVIKAKAVSSSEVEYKRAILSKKSELINIAVKNALEGIKSSESNVYFGYIEKLILKNALEGKGTLCLSAKDFERLPEGFVEKINSQLPGGKSVELSKEAALFDGGFVIEYPETKIDCTFESLLEDKLDEIRDELSKILFS